MPSLIDLLVDTRDQITGKDMNQNQKLQLAFYVLMILGAGEVLGALIIGIYIDKYDSKKAAKLNILIMIVTILATFLTIHNHKSSYQMYAMGGLWGFLDGTINVHLMQVLGFEFEKYQFGEPYCVFFLVQGIATISCRLIQ